MRKEYKADFKKQEIELADSLQNGAEAARQFGDFRV